MPGSLPTNWLDPIAWGTGLVETANTLGTDRLDVRVPPDQYRIGGLQITNLKNFAVAVSAWFQGGARLKVLSQTGNPFTAGEAGFWTDGTSAKFTSTTGTVTTLGGLSQSVTAIDTPTAVSMSIGATNASDVSVWGGSGGVRVYQKNAASGSTPDPQFWSRPTAHTALAAGVEWNQAYFQGGSPTWQAGALATQRTVYITPQTLNFANPSTVSTAATLAINNAPIAGTNATITNAYALHVIAGYSMFGGTVQTPTLKTQRIQTMQYGSPSITINTTTCGTGATATVTGNDCAGTIDLTTGTGTTGNGSLFTLNWSLSYSGTKPVVILTPRTSTTAPLSGAAQVFYASSTSNLSSADIRVGATALAASTTYGWCYVAIQTV